MSALEYNTNFNQTDLHKYTNAVWYDKAGDNATGEIGNFQKPYADPAAAVAAASAGMVVVGYGGDFSATPITPKNHVDIVNRGTIDFAAHNSSTMNISVTGGGVILSYINNASQGNGILYTDNYISGNARFSEKSTQIKNCGGNVEIDQGSSPISSSYFEYNKITGNLTITNGYEWTGQLVWGNINDNSTNYTSSYVKLIYGDYIMSGNGSYQKHCEIGVLFGAITARDCYIYVNQKQGFNLLKLINAHYEGQKIRGNIDIDATSLISVNEIEGGLSNNLTYALGAKIYINGKKSSYVNTTDATIKEIDKIFISSVAAGQSTHFVRIFVCAKQFTGGTNSGVWYKYGKITNISGTITFNLVDQFTDKTNVNYDVTVSASGIGAYTLNVKGDAGENLYWNAEIEILRSNELV